jgi:peptide/nickel transport system permease protein
MKGFRSWYEEHKNEYLIRVTKSLLQNKLGVTGGAIVLFFLLIAFLAPLISPHDPTWFKTEDRIRPPSTQYPFGTDLFGRDVLSRIIWGSRNSISVSIISVVIGMSIGVLLGAIAGYYGRWIDEIIMRAMDVLLAFPVILLALLIIAVLGPSLQNLMIAIGIVYIPRFARTVRGDFLTIREMAYIEAAKAVADSDPRIMFREMLPNDMAPIIVNATVCFGISILTEGALSFLGLGVQPPEPSWGNMLSDAKELLMIAPWASIFPGLTIVFAVLGINLLGDGLRDALDPRLMID